MDGHYKLINEDKKSIYVIFGIVSLLLIIIVFYAVFTLVIYGPQAQVNALPFLGGVYYVPAPVYFFACTLVSAFFFGYFCYYIASDLKRSNADRILNALRGDIKNLEGRLMDDFEKKFVKISMDQFMIIQNFKDVEAKIATHYEKMEKVLQNCRKFEEFLDKQTSVSGDLKKKARTKPKN